MKFVADEGVNGTLVNLLREAGHDVLYFAELPQNTSDPTILNLANADFRILITRDKDFGELVYRAKMVHAGIILVRLEELKSMTRSQMVADFIEKNLGILSDSFIVLQAGAARIRNLKN